MGLVGVAAGPAPSNLPVFSSALRVHREEKGSLKDTALCPPLPALEEGMSVLPALSALRTLEQSPACVLSTSCGAQDADWCFPGLD